MDIDTLNPCACNYVTIRADQTESITVKSTYSGRSGGHTRRTIARVDKAGKFRWRGASSE